MKIAAPTLPVMPPAPKSSDTAQAPASPPPNVADTVVFQDPPGEGHRIAFEAAANVGNAFGGLLEGAGKIGQAVEVGSMALGLKPGGPAALAGLVGGTFDVARGASITMMSGFNRNLPGAVLGSIQLTQGLATWAASASCLIGAPPVVGQAASVVALAAYAGHQGYTQYLKHKAAHPSEKGPKDPHSETDASHKLGQAPKLGSGLLGQALATDKQFNEFGSGLHINQKYVKTPAELPGADAVPKKGRGIEKTIAFTSSINAGAQKLTTGMALWNTAQVLFTGHAPGLGWGAMGVVGGTYNAAQGLALLRHGSGNLHIQDSVDGFFGVLTGAGQLGASMGLGRPAAGLALGAFVAKQAVSLYLKKKQLSGSTENSEKSVVDRVIDNVKQVVGPAPETKKV